MGTFQVESCQGGKGGSEIDPVAGKATSKLSTVNSLGSPEEMKSEGGPVHCVRCSRGSSASEFMRGGQLDLSCTGHSAVRLIPVNGEELQHDLVGCPLALLACRTSED